jgi:hypothetical protein
MDTILAEEYWLQMGYLANENVIASGNTSSTSLVKCIAPKQYKLL